VIRGLVLLSMKFRVLVVGAAVLVLGLGITQVRNASVDVLPEFAPPQVEIQAEALGLSAAEVEQLITVPLEHAMVRLMPAGDDQGKIIARGFPGGAVSPQSFSRAA
jgi:Cu/Ag efflux pump CusA